MPISIRAATEADLLVVRGIAAQAWPAAFSGIISQEQLAYDFARDYSDERLQAQRQAGQCHLILEQFGENPPEPQAVGFASYTIQPDCFTINRIYLLPHCKGQGMGTQLMTALLGIARKSGSPRAELHVNRQNPAVAFYRKAGFEIAEAVDQPIGQGFIREDYRMVLSLSNPAQSQDQATI